MSPNQQRINVYDTRKDVAVFYFYRVPERTKSDRELYLYRDIYGWGI